MMYYDLEAWKISITLAEEIYMQTRRFPKEELFGLISQMRRAVVSIPSNIAEGSARQSSRENIRFLQIARGSLAELETQVELASRIGFLPEENFQKIRSLLTRTGKLLNGLALRADTRLREAESDNF